MNSRMMRYDRVIRRLNEFRKQGYAFGLIASFGEASIGAATDSVRSNSLLHLDTLFSGVRCYITLQRVLTSLVNVDVKQKSVQTTETWRLLSHLVQERDVLNGEFQRTSLTERQYAGAYLSEDQESVDASQVRKMISDGAREHLEEQSVHSRCSFHALWPWTEQHW
jgi:nuclear pore complex protein Nup93